MPNVEGYLYPDQFPEIDRHQMPNQPLLAHSQTLQRLYEAEAFQGKVMRRLDEIEHTLQKILEKLEA